MNLNVIKPFKAKVPVGASEKYTNAPMLPSLIVALAGGTLTLGIGFLLKGMVPYFYSLIYQRGSIQYLTIYCFWFAVGMLVFKWLMLRQERVAFSLPFVKQFTLGMDRAGKTTMLDQHLLLEENLDIQQRNHILISRINKGIKQVRINNSPAEVANVLSTASSTDSAIIDSSYVPIKFMIWVIPILGFVGTIMGMSKAIGSFDAVLKGIKEVGFQGMQTALGRVTAGLAVAFDTTFLALILSAFINLLANAMQKKEEDLLSDVEDFTTENIVNKFSAVPAQPVTGPGQQPGAAGPDWGGVQRELRNLSKQGQANANISQEQMGRIIEAINDLKAQQVAGAEPAAGLSIDPALPGALQEFSRILQENAQSFKAICQMADVIKGNAEAIESLKAPIAEMNVINRKLGELYGKIYKTDFLD